MPRYEPVSRDTYPRQSAPAKEHRFHLLSFRTIELLAITVCLAGIGWVTVYAAETGLVVIPYVSDWVYDRPAPDPRIDAPASTALIDRLKRELAAAQQAHAKDDAYTIPITVSQEELSAAVRSLLASVDAIEYIQTAVTAEGIRVFCALRSPQVVLTLDVIPKLTPQGVRVDIGTAKIGERAVPVSMGTWLIEKSVINPLLSAQQTVLNLASTSVTDVSFEPGTLHAMVAVTPSSYVD